MAHKILGNISVLSDEPDDLNDGLDEPLPAQLRKTIYRCLSKKPDERYSAAELKTQLNAIYRQL